MESEEESGEAAETGGGGCLREEISRSGGEEKAEDLKKMVGRLLAWLALCPPLPSAPRLPLMMMRRRLDEMKKDFWLGGCLASQIHTAKSISHSH